jgi:hypothetical protein
MTTMTAMDSDLGLLVWATRGFMLLVSLAVVAVVAFTWLVLVVPVGVEVRRAVSTGDWWYAFLPREHGWGPLADNRWWALFRAERRGAATGLAWRWGFWVTEAVVVAGATTFALVVGAGVVADGWP